MRKRAITAALTLALTCLAAPAWALWSQTITATLPTVALGQVAFAAIPQDTNTAVLSDHGKPVTLELTETTLTALLSAAETSGQPAVWKFTITGRADSTSGLDYNLTATASGELPFHIELARPDGKCQAATEPGAGGQVTINAPSPVTLQPPGPPGTHAPVTKQEWCVSIPPILLGRYVNAAELSANTEDGTTLRAHDTWHANLIADPTPASARGAHLEIVANPTITK